MASSVLVESEIDKQLYQMDTWHSNVRFKCVEENGATVQGDDKNYFDMSQIFAFKF